MSVSTTEGSRSAERVPCASPPATRVAVVVLNWNGLQDTRACLHSVLDQGFEPLQIHVVDNGSANGEATALAREFGDRIRLHLSEHNLGFTGGCNLALEVVLREEWADCVALLNNDAEAEPGWLSALVEAARTDPGAGIFASCMLDYARPDRLENAGVELLWTGDAVPRGRGRPAASFRRPVRLLSACGGAMMVRTEVLRRIGLFRVDFFANFEDVDLCLRAVTCGYGCLYVPGARVRHKLGQSIGRLRSEAFHVRSLRNLTWAVWVNVPAPVLAFDLPWMLLRDLLVVVCAPWFGVAEIGRMVRASRLAVWRERSDLLAERRRLRAVRSGGWWAIWGRQRAPVRTYWRFFVDACIRRKRRFLEA